MKRLVAFDLDGTLAASNRSLVRLMAERNRTGGLQ